METYVGPELAIQKRKFIHHGEHERFYALLEPHEGSEVTTETLHASCIANGLMPVRLSFPPPRVFEGPAWFVWGTSEEPFLQYRSSDARKFVSLQMKGLLVKVAYVEVIEGR